MDEGTSGFIGGLLISLIIVTSAIAIIKPYDSMRKEIRKDAIENGVGEYYINDKQEKKFRWIDCKSEKK